MKALITRKLGMTSVINENGDTIAITLLAASPNVVTQLKNEGYNALQLGFEENKKPAKPQRGQFKNFKIIPKIVREIRISEPTNLNLGDQLDAEIFEIGDKVDVTGLSRGKGFAGTIKRYRFQRGPKTHGGRNYRKPGSIGSMFPQRIFPGKKMAGHMGHKRVTVKRLRIALVDKQQSVIGVEGAVPGPKKSVVLVKEAK